MMEHAEEQKYRELASKCLLLIRTHPELIVDSLLHEHRTTQQQTIRNVHTILKAYGTFDTDLRNESAVNWAREASNLDSAVFPYI